MDKKKTHTLLKYFWISFASIIVLIVLCFVLIVKGYIGYIPEIEELQNPKNRFATELYTSDGVMFGRYFYGQDNRVAVNYRQISPHVVNALVATEDARFFSHSGIDTKSLVRSIVLRGFFGKKVPEEAVPLRNSWLNNYILQMLIIFFKELSKSL